MPTELETEAKPAGAKAPKTPLHVVLHAPDIPQNTGNVGRTCAYVGARLHLVHPLGFQLDDRHLRRAGMDYWRTLDVVEHADWAAFCRSPLGPSRLWLYTTRAKQSFWHASYAPGDGLVFGSETAGAPGWLHKAIGPGAALRIDGNNAGLRSLNLASSVAIATYEAWRQLSGP